MAGLSCAELRHVERQEVQVVHVVTILLVGSDQLRALLEHGLGLFVELHRLVEFGQGRVEVRDARVVLDRLRVVLERVLLFVRGPVGLAEKLVALGPIRVLFDALLQRLLGVFVLVRVARLGQLGSAPDRACPSSWRSRERR